MDESGHFDGLKVMDSMFFKRAGMFLLSGALLLSACGPKGLAARMANGERIATEAENALDEAERSMEALDANRAQGKLEEARHFLSLGDLRVLPRTHALASTFGGERAEASRGP